MSNQQSQGTEPGPAAPPQPAAHTATASAGAAATPPFWPGAQQYGPPQYGPHQFGPPQYGPPQAQGNGHHQSGAWFVSTPPTPQARAATPSFWPGANQYAHPQSPMFGQYGPNPWFASTPPAPASEPPKKRRPGRPSKVKKSEDEDEPYMPPRNQQCQTPEKPALKLPARSPHDVKIPRKDEDRCCVCEYWIGRYTLKPCFHFGFCINCLEKYYKLNLKPQCLACHTPIEEFLSSIKCSITDIANADDE